MNALLSVTAWIEFGLVAIGGFFIQLALALLTWPFDFRRKRISGRFSRDIATTVARTSPFWNFRVEGPCPRRIPGRTVVVSNHESNADPFLISFLPWEMKWMAKASLFRIPFLGWTFWLAGDIPVIRGTKSSGQAALDQCRRYLELDMPVMIFPEGTRSPTEELLPFKDGAFRLALETGADILPVAVSGTRRALPKHSWRFSKAKALVTLGQPIPTRGLGPEQLEPLKAQVRAAILDLRAKLQAKLASDVSA